MRISKRVRASAGPAAAVALVAGAAFAGALWVAPAAAGPEAGAAAAAAAPPSSNAAAAIASGDLRPEDIPPGYDFPAERRRVDRWVATDDVAEMRRHAWDLWGGMTVRSHADPVLPIWETWYSEDEIFRARTAPTGVRRGSKRPFARPRQLANEPGARVSPATALQVVAFNKFNRDSGHFLMASHAGPGGRKYDYTQQADLTALDNAWPTLTPVVDRKVAEFPNPAVDLKPVFWLVKQNGLTAIPFWQGNGAGAIVPGNEANPTPNTWLNCVLVDPKGTGGLRKATPQEVAQANADTGLACAAAKYLYAPLQMIYGFRMSADEAGDFNQAQGGPGVLTAAKGDWAVLVAMHVTTKEIVNWTWQTYFWMAGTSPPNDWPGSLAGQTNRVKGQWRNYAMCVAYSMVVPANDPKGRPVVCFNPYLETNQVDGLNSNCMSCHGVARWPGTNNGHHYPQTYLPNGFIDFASKAWFGGQTRTDFAWAIPDNAVAAPTPAPSPAAKASGGR